jgi:hypothetical protein
LSQRTSENEARRRKGLRWKFYRDGENEVRELFGKLSG